MDIYTRLWAYYTVPKLKTRRYPRGHWRINSEFTLHLVSTKTLGWRKKKRINRLCLKTYSKLTYANRDPMRTQYYYNNIAEWDSKTRSRFIHGLCVGAHWWNVLFSSFGISFMVYLAENRRKTPSCMWFLSI